jgi:hypothetical protein
LGCAAQQRLAFVGRQVLRQRLESIPQAGVAAAGSVYREVAFEHAALWAKYIEADLEVRAPRFGQRLRRRGLWSLAPGKTCNWHGQATKLHEHIVEGFECIYGAPPRLKDLWPPLGIGANAQGTPAVIHHDDQVGTGPGQHHHIVELTEVDPGVER